jgi:hypothetical protein
LRSLFGQTLSAPAVSSPMLMPPHAHMPAAACERNKA